MTFQRNLLLASAIGLFLAGGVASNDALARQKDADAQHDSKHDKDKGDKGKAHEAKARSDKAHDQRDDRARDGRADAQRRADVQHRAEAEARAREAQHREAVAHSRDAQRRVEAEAHARDVHYRQDAQHRQDAQAHARNEARAAERREIQYDRRQMIALQERREAEYRRHLAAVRAADARRIAAINAERRAQQYRYQQWYWQQQQALQPRWVPRDYDVERYYAAPVSYRYYRDGRAYAVNRYAADLLQQAVRYGYEQGVRAGNADRLDGWRSDWRNNYAYQDASYGYGGYYVDQSEYNYYFRQGFQRGYQDAYGNDYRYGTRTNNNNNNDLAVILTSVLQSVLGLQPYQQY